MDRIPKSNLTLVARKIAWRNLCGIIALYVVLLAAALYKSNGIPYGLDGNETFSSAIHARNLGTFSLKSSFGLTDESYATSEKGHPMVHSHQGNFPRLFTFLLYELGAHDVRTQIWITSLLVGAAAISVTFLFFNITADEILASAVCLIFLSDYFLFGQWILNTYRVWHSFFFFSSLLCVVASKRCSRTTFALTALNFFCLCYWEYVYATFVVVLCVIYSLSRARMNFSHARSFLIPAFAGVLTAAGTLLAQLVAYAGWQNTLTDISYTLHARNSAASELFSQRAAAFYSHLNILFWPNYVDITELRTWHGFIDSLVVHHLQYYSPWLAFLMIATFVGWSLALARWPQGERIDHTLNHFSPRKRNFFNEELSVPMDHSQAVAMRTTVKWRSFSAKAEIAWAANNENSAELSERIGYLSNTVSTFWNFLARAAVISSFAFCAIFLAFGNRSTPIASNFSDTFSFFRAHSYIGFISLVLFVTFVSWLCFGSALRFGRVKWARVIAAGTFSLYAGLWFGHAYHWFDWSHLVLWTRAGLPGSCFSYLAYFVAFLTLGLIIVSDPRFLFGFRQLDTVRASLTLTSCGICAYAIVYLIFTGYIYSGYLDRQAPFLVFLSDPLLALLFYTLAIPIGNLGSRLWAARSRPAERRTVKNYRRATIWAALVLSFCTICFGWLSLQRELLKIVPINNYAFLSKLTAAPYKGKSFVVSTYAAPIAVQTHSWAYLEPVFFGATLHLTGHGFRYEREDTYKWFADSNSNLAYEKPDYAIAIRSTSWNELFDLYLKYGSEQRVRLEDSIGIVSQAAKPFRQYLFNRIVEMDEDRQRDSFAIIKLDWDYPAYLLPLPINYQKISQSLEQFPKPIWDIKIESLPERIFSSSSRPYLKSISTESQESDAFTSSSNAGTDLVNDPGSSSQDKRVSNGLISKAVVCGSDLVITLRTGPTQGLASVEVNDWIGREDLFSPTEGEMEVSFHADNTLGNYPGRAAPVPGQYVGLSRNGDKLNVQYSYAQQDKLPEDLTTIDLVGQDASGTLHLVSSYLTIGKGAFLIDTNAFFKSNRDTLEEFTRLRSIGDTRTYFHWLSDYLGAHPEEFRRTGIEVRKSGPASSTSLNIDSILLQVPETQYTRVFAILKPGTSTKSGPNYPSNAVNLSHVENAYGAVHLTLRLPDGDHKLTEPLISAGTVKSGNLLYLIYENSKSIRIGFTDRKRVHLISPPIDVIPNSTHEVELSDGSLLPEPEFAYENSWDPKSLLLQRRQIEVRLDGRPIFQVQGDLATVSPSTVVAGLNNVGVEQCAETFSGTIISFSRVDPAAFNTAKGALAKGANTFGPIILKVKFPRDRTGQNEPLVTSGVTGAGDFIYVTYLDRDHIQISFDHWGVKGAKGSPIEIDYNKFHEIEITMGSLFPQDGDSRFEGSSADEVDRLKRNVSVKVDGQPSLETSSECYESPSNFVNIGENRIGGSTTGPSFSGSIISTFRVSNPLGK